MSLLLGSASAKVSLDIGSFMANASTAESKMNQLANAGGTGTGGGLFDKMTKGALGLGTALIAPMALGLQSAISLEQGIANINASLGGIDASTLDQLAASFNEIGAASQYSATEVAAIADSLAKAGFTTEELLGGATQAVVDLSQATGDGLQPATDAIITSMSIWSEEIVGVENAMTDSTRIADIYTVAANNSSAGIGDINAGMRSLGPVAAGLGISLEDSAAAIALFTNYGLKGADAGISLARGLSNLADPASTLDADLSELGLSMDGLGISAFDLEGNFVGFPTLFDQLNTGMSGLDDKTKQAALGMIFGAEAADVMAIAIATGADPLEALIELMGETGTASEQSALRMNTLGAQFDTLKEGVMTFLGSLVTGLIPGMRWVVDGANVLLDVLMRIPAPIKTIIGAIAGSLAVFAAITQAMRAFSLISGLLGGTGFLGMGVSLGALIPIALGVAAVAGLIYVAWKTNFLGLRDVVKGAFKPISKFIDRFKKSFSSLEKGADNIKTWGSAMGEAAGYANTFSNVLAALGMALRGIGGGDFAWIATVANGLERAAGFVDRFKSAWDSLGTVTTDLGQFAEQWEGLSVTTGPNLDLFTRGMQALDIATGGAITRLREMTALDIVISIGSFIFDGLASIWDEIARQITGIPQGTPVTLGDVVASVTSWAQGEIADIWSSIKNWATDGGTDPLTLTGILVNVGEWARGQIADLWSAVSGWVLGTTSGDPGLSGDGTGGARPDREFTLGGILVNVTDWAQGVIADVWTAVKGFIFGGGGDDANRPGSVAAGASGGEGITLSGVLVNIGGWLQGVIEPLWETVKGWFTSGGVNRPGSVAAGASSGGGLTIPSVAVNIGSWIQGTIADLWGTIKGWFTGEGGGANRPGSIAAGASSGGGGITIPSVLVDITGWAQGKIADLWSTVRGWFTGGGGGMEAAPGGMRASGSGVSLGDVLVNIGSWAKGIVSDIWPYVTQWASDAMSGIASAAGTIWNVLVNVGSWAKGIVSDIWPYISQFAAAAWDAVSSTAHTVWGVLVNVGSYLPGGEIADIASAIDGSVQSAYDAYVAAGVAPQLDKVPVEVTGIDVTVQEGAMAEGFPTDPDEGVLSQVYDKGFQYGFVPMQKFVDGVNSAFSDYSDWAQGSGAGGGGGGGGVFGAIVGIGAGIVGAFDGAMSAASNGMRSIPQTFFNDIMKPALDNMFGLQSPPALAIKSGVNKLKIFTENAWDGLSDIDFPTPDFTWPDLPSLSDIPFVTDFVELLGSVAELFRGIDWSFDIGIPDIDWPDVSDLVPQDIKDFLADPWGYASSQFGDSGENSDLSVPAGDENPDLKPRPGGDIGRQLASINTSGAIASLDAFDRKIVTVTERLAALRAPGGAGAGITVDTTGAISSLKNLDLTIDGTQLKLAALGGGGGGRTAGGAGAGAGAIKITADNTDALAKIGAVKDAISGLGGGGGPAALKGAAQGGGGIVITANNAAAMQAIGDVSAGLFGLASMVSAVVITGNNAAAMQSIGDVSAGMAGINGMSSLVVLLGDNGAAMQSIGDVSAGMFGIDGMTSTIYIKGDKSHAMAAINAVAAYAGRSLGTATFTVRTVTVGSPRRVGAGMGAGMLKGWDRATGTNSPSTEMRKRGHYLYQGLDLGWTGSASNLPIGFNVTPPTLPPIPVTAPNVGTNRGGGGTVIHYHSEVNMPVAGSVVTEDGLILKAVQAVGTGLQQGEQALKRSLGVS